MGDEPMQGSDGRAERVLRQSRALGDDVRSLASELGEAAREVREKVDVSRAVREHPFRAVAIATGVGYLLGGGLFSSWTRHALGVGARMMLVPILKAQLDAMVTGGPQEP